MLVACQFPWSSGDRPCADHARLDLPVDIALFAAKGTLWPFGVHGGPSPEGHPGMDFILDSADVKGDLDVKASFTAEILSITPETEYPGSSCIVMDSACVEVNLCHLHLDASLQPGMTVKRGQKLGTVGLIAAEGKYNLHFGTYGGREADLICPDEYLDPDIVRCTLGRSLGGTAPADCGNASGTVTMLGRSVYAESVARQVPVKCADGTTQSFSLPAETAFCAPRLSDADRNRLNTCLGASCAGIW